TSHTHSLSLSLSLSLPLSLSPLFSTPLPSPLLSSSPLLPSPGVSFSPLPRTHCRNRAPHNTHTHTHTHTPTHTHLPHTSISYPVDCATSAARPLISLFAVFAT